MKPVVALASAGGRPSRLVPLLSVLGTDVDVVSWERHRAAGRPRPNAVVAAGVAALDRLPPVPTAAWVDDIEGFEAAAAAGALAMLTDDESLVEQGAVLVPRTGIDTDRWPPLPPVVRDRWRRRLGLPDDVVVEVRPGAPAEDMRTDLALATVAVVSGPATVLALALATPVVTGSDTAGRLGLRGGLDAEVVDEPDRAGAMARLLAADRDRTAAMSRRGRRFAERRLDLAGPARELRRRLGLVPSHVAAGPAVLIEARLEELATPSTALLRQRVADAFEAFDCLVPGAIP